MEYVIQLGERAYALNGMAQVNKARDIHAQFTGNQNALEAELEAHGIDFSLEMPGSYSPSERGAPS